MKSNSLYLLWKSRYWLTILSLLLPATSFAQPTLWQAKRGTQELYLFGSIHIGSPSLYPLPKPVIKAFNQSSRLWVEVDTRHLSEKSIKKINQYITLPKGKQLQDELSPKLLMQLKHNSKPLGLDYNKLQHFYPWYISIMVTQKIYQKMGYDGKLGVDQFFLRRATHTDKPVSSLESATQQFKALASLKNDQRELLSQALSTDDAVEKTLNLTVDAWRKGNQKRLASLLNLAKSTNNAAQKHFEYRLLEKRNRRWLRILSKNTSQHPQFVVVGALHLSGPYGLIHMLRKSGYTVKRIPEAQS
ncbi:MAG: hypothetical protein CENE_03610 [Candidatus Celerinatantimonas neptuna]|nr:MAG: hypothetical protein CENE_03610 [Candidatus Celerinatantimonas neptuna]